jgi:hypothetical protein
VFFSVVTAGLANLAFPAFLASFKVFFLGTGDAGEVVADLVAVMMNILSFVIALEFVCTSNAISETHTLHRGCFPVLYSCEMKRKPDRSRKWFP